MLETWAGEKESRTSCTQTILYLKENIKEYKYNLLDLKIIQLRWIIEKGIVNLQEQNDTGLYEVSIYSKMWRTKYLGIYYQKHSAHQNKQVYFGCCDMNMKSFNNEYFLNKNNFWILVLKSIKSRQCMMIAPNHNVCLFEHGFNW